MAKAKREKSMKTNQTDQHGGLEILSRQVGTYGFDFYGIISDEQRSRNTILIYL